VCGLEETKERQEGREEKEEGHTTSKIGSSNSEMIYESPCPPCAHHLHPKSKKEEQILEHMVYGLGFRV